MTVAITMSTAIWIPLSFTLSEFQDTRYITTNAQAYGGTVMRLAFGPSYPKSAFVNTCLAVWMSYTYWRQ